MFTKQAQHSTSALADLLGTSANPHSITNVAVSNAARPKFKTLLNLLSPLRNIFTTALLLTTVVFASSNAMALELAPDFTLKSKDGGNIRLSEQRGNIVMVNFWASWCGPCRQELPKMEELYQEYQDMGFEILAINVDDEESKADILLNDIEVTFPVLYDTAGNVSKLYDVSAMPTTVIIDRDGNQRLVHLGYRAGDEIKYEKALKILMRE